MANGLRPLYDRHNPPHWFWRDRFDGHTVLGLLTAANILIWFIL